MNPWAPSRPSVVMVSSFPPGLDGIARYADQMAGELRGDGVRVRRVGITPASGGDEVIDIHAPPYALQLLRLTTTQDELLVHWHPHYYAVGRFSERAAKFLALWALMHLRQATVLVHEPDDPPLPAVGLVRRVAGTIGPGFKELMWTAPATYAFHTDFEYRQHLRAHRRGRRRRFAQIAHGSGFTTQTTADRRTAREQLDVPVEGVLLACLGFIAPHKAFDRAVAAVAATNRPDLRLHIAGAPMRDDDATAQHVLALRAAADADPRVTFREEFLSDAEFDLWLRAADAIVAPYKRAASSSVVPRARLLGTPIITSGAGGLREQVGPGDVLFDGDDQLAEIVRSWPATSPRVA